MSVDFLTFLYTLCILTIKINSLCSTDSLKRLNKINKVYIMNTKYMQTFKNSQRETVLQNSSFKSRRGKSPKREKLFVLILYLIGHLVSIPLRITNWPAWTQKLLRLTRSDFTNVLFG